MKKHVLVVRISHNLDAPDELDKLLEIEDDEEATKFLDQLYGDKPSSFEIRGKIEQFLRQHRLFESPPVVVNGPLLIHFEEERAAKGGKEKREQALDIKKDEDYLTLAYLLRVWEKPQVAMIVRECKKHFKKWSQWVKFEIA